MAQFQFNATAAPAPQQRSYGPLPEGSYQAVITRSDIKPTKAGTGNYIELEIQITDGEFSGRRLWERLNVDNPNKRAEDIAKAALGQLCAAVGVVDMDDTEQLHDIPFIVGVEIDRKEPDRNRIVAYEPAATAPAPAKPAATPSAPARPAAARPWQK